MTLEDFFKENPRAGIAFSGGVDSAYLLYAALHAGARVTAYYVKTAFQPQFELDDARRLADELKADLRVIPLEALTPEVRSNPADRCYHCKKNLFSAIAAAAGQEGYRLLLDGTNASDEEGDRPGMRALRELAVCSPLRECGLSKPEIRRLSRKAGLFTWSKPAYACLATRIPTGEEITPEKLRATEESEGYLFSLGFRDFRVRLFHGAARIQLRHEDGERLLAHREEISAALKRYYSAVLYDLEDRK